jgi:hypothetical protein
LYSFLFHERNEGKEKKEEEKEEEKKKKIDYYYGYDSITFYSLSLFLQTVINNNENISIYIRRLTSDIVLEAISRARSAPSAKTAST